MTLLAGLRERRDRGVLAGELEVARARVAALETVATMMLGCVRSLVLDLEELGALEVMEGLRAFATQIRAAGDVHELAAEAARRRGEILAFADRQRAYLESRDAELRRIIEALSDRLAGAGAGASAYHRRLHDNGARLEAALRLSDVMPMRAAVTAEVRRLRTVIAGRQAEELTATRVLSTEIEALRQNVARARTEARTDPLTGVANRGAFDEELARRCALATAGRECFALVFAEIDHFQQINDTYGHRVGDRVLTAFAGFLRARVREHDLVARCGGEAFGVVLPGASLRPALRTARRLIVELARRNWAVDPVTKLRFTASMGVAEGRAGDDPGGVLERVDRALYRSKHEGHNRVSKSA